MAGDGGDTEFANLTAAYEALPEEGKAEIADLRVIHSFATAQKRAERYADANAFATELARLLALAEELASAG